MNFRTSIQIEESPFTIGHTDGLLAMGSCFTEHIGDLLHYSQFDISKNPLGIAYNPISISKQLLMALTHNLEEDGFLRQSQQWIHYDFHSKFSSSNREELVQLINQSIQRVHSTLKDKKIIILSFGTSIVFRHKKTGSIVNNCHKQDAGSFEKIQLSATQMIKAMEIPLKKLKELNPQLEFIFTISPVRHLRFGMKENSVSKAALVWTINELTKQYDYCHYFPSYEIFMDDLRDYRFYGSDMLHPSKEGIKYIWQCFSETYFSKDTIDLNHKIKQIQQGLAHRPFHEASNEHQQFRTNLNNKIEALKTSHPKICWNI